ncbi:2-hydroxyacid dehydrogenase [Phormidium tenue FACHB-886]|nr:2-hydroxyacid dehydrogenase [Phormidium tenue FACHB-886]
MKVAVFSTKAYDQRFLDQFNGDFDHELTYLEPRLSVETAPLAAGFPAVCLFVSDVADAQTLEVLASNGTKLIALRSAGFNHVDLKRASELGLTVLRVPAYSPYAVAEHTIALILTLNRKTHRAYNRIREGNFSLNGLLGFDLNNRTVGVIGTGKIGAIFGQIMRGFGCRLIGYDKFKSAKFEEIGGTYVDLPDLFSASDIISLHCPLTPATRHLINREAIAQMKPSVMLINTSRGALVDTEAVIDGLKTRKIGGLGLDVYEQESDLFFEDLSGEIIQDDVFERLLTFPNVLVTGHQAFFTEEALANIAQTTLLNITAFEQGQGCANEVKAEEMVAAKAPA